MRSLRLVGKSRSICRMKVCLCGQPYAHLHRMTRVGNPFLIELLSNRRQPLHKKEGKKGYERG